MKKLATHNIEVIHRALDKSSISKIRKIIRAGRCLCGGLVVKAQGKIICVKCDYKYPALELLRNLAKVQREKK